MINVIKGQICSFSKEREGLAYTFKVTLSKNLTECACEAWRYSADLEADKVCKHQPYIMSGLLQASEAHLDLSRPLTIIRRVDQPLTVRVFVV